jgi:hypothetical protein
MPDHIEAEVPVIAEQSPAQVQDERSAFLDAPPPKEIEKQAKAIAPAQPAPKVETPKPSQPVAPEKPAISQHMVDLAEGFGLSAEEAKQYGSDAELGRALKLASRMRQQQPAPEAKKETPKPVEDEDADLAFVHGEDAYDGLIVAQNKAIKALRKELKELKKLEEKIPEHVGRHMAYTQQVERDNKLMGDLLEEGGYDRGAIQDPATRTKIINLANSLLEPFTKLGVKPPEMKTLVKQVLPLALGEAKGAPQRKTLAEEQKAAIERDRNERGQFVKQADAPGSPSHRQSAIGLNGNGTNGGNLRTNLMDKGIDPGPAPIADDHEAFLDFRK